MNPAAITTIFAAMLFKDIIGQEQTGNNLAELVQHNRLSHALLFLGKEGSGALPLALAFAQYIVCEWKNGKPVSPQSAGLFGAPEPETDDATGTGSSTMLSACGQCSSCLKAAQMVHPDIHFSYPVIPRKAGDKPVSTDYITEWREFQKLYPYGNVFDWLQFIGAENKQGNITAHECNEIIRKLNLKSFESEYKILVMWMPEYLGNEGNKLLKLIEEPPPNTLFILVAESEAQILQTILSRCQLVKIPIPEDAQIAAALETKCGLEPAKARAIAAISEGNYREALQQMQHAGDDWMDLLREWLNSILKSGPTAQVKWIEEMAKQGREKQKQFLKYFCHLLEQSVRAGVLPPDKISASETELDFANRLNKLTNIHQQEAIIKELDQAAYYIERNANAKMLFHALTIKLSHIIRNKSLILMD